MKHALFRSDLGVLRREVRRFSCNDSGNIVSRWFSLKLAHGGTWRSLIQMLLLIKKFYDSSLKNIARSKVSNETELKTFS